MRSRIPRVVDRNSIQPASRSGDILDGTAPSISGTPGRHPGSACRPGGPAAVRAGKGGARGMVCAGSHERTRQRRGDGREAGGGRRARATKTMTKGRDRSRPYAVRTGPTRAPACRYFLLLLLFFFLFFLSFFVSLFFLAISDTPTNINQPPRRRDGNFLKLGAWNGSYDSGRLPFQVNGLRADWNETAARRKSGACSCDKR